MSNETKHKPGPLESLAAKARLVLAHCEMCGARSNALLEPGFDPSGKPKVLCYDCRIGSAELLADRRTELLEVLKATRQFLGCGEYDGHTENCILKVVDDAVAKAEGR